MDLLEILSYAAGAIRLRKLRAGLTILGITIGITALVGLLAMTQGFQASVQTQLQRGFATDAVVVTTQNLGFGYPVENFQMQINDTAIINSLSNIKQSVAIIQEGCYAKSGNITLTVSVVGVDFSKYASIYPNSFVAENGNIPSSPDETDAIVGVRVNDPWKNGTLFAAINQEFDIVYTTRNGAQFTNQTLAVKTVALLREIGGSTLGGPSDYSIYIPLSTAQDFFGTNQTSTIIVQLEKNDQNSIDQTSKAIESAFNNEVLVVSSTSIFNTINSVMVRVQMLMTAVIAISLFVAGVGIMNIMIISLMERTKEIGIMKAIGMRDGTVLSVFLSESIIMGLTGTLLGIGLGYLLAFGINQLDLLGGMINSATQGTIMGGIPMYPILTLTNILSAFGFGLAVSIFFGIYPAWRASRLEPVDALRYE
ncbi:MAG TPA: FtsX-like permease family protein [candidate division Zixibacteria bacterium]|nr:FtsX-like permease family protein [candidate division Zixibacteria bacterium]